MFRLLQESPVNSAMDNYYRLQIHAYWHDHLTVRIYCGRDHTDGLIPSVVLRLLHQNILLSDTESVLLHNPGLQSYLSHDLLQSPEVLPASYDCFPDSKSFHLPMCKNNCSPMDLQESYGLLPPPVLPFLLLQSYPLTLQLQLKEVLTVLCPHTVCKYFSCHTDRIP